MELTSKGFLLAATDLANHVACQHTTQLNKKGARGELKRPYRNDPSLEVLETRGREHEAAYVKFLESKGLSIIDLRGKGLNNTLVAMAKGIDVIVQVTLEDSKWSGTADVLLKVPGKSKFGDWSYEIQDTKLAQNTKTTTVLQLCVYSDLLSKIQESVPVRMHVIKPGNDFPVESFNCADFQAYYRLVKERLERIVDGPDVLTYPEPVQHCDICSWWSRCNKQRHDDDYLSLVAGIRSLQIESLKKQDIKTLESFAKADKITIPRRSNEESFLRRQAQAKVQLEGRVKDQLLYKPLPVVDDRGLHRLPVPNQGDIYFDIEGDAFYPNGGLEYMFGFAYKEKDDKIIYKNQWATNKLEEKRAFEGFMQLVVSRWKQFPNLHIYHFAPYEPSAIKRLASNHAVFEREVDELLRAERFVDLHMVFKEAFLASVEHYSLKALEKFTQYTRVVVLEDAAIARKNVECALELNDFKSLAKETLVAVEKYNADDCFATEALHTWLEKLRTSYINEGVNFQRPSKKPQEVGEKLKQQEVRSKALYDALVKQLPEDRGTWSQEEEAKWLLAHQMDYFRREEKSAWWEYFRVHKMEYEDLLDERKAVTGLVFMEELPPKPKQRTPVHRYKYPPQEMGLVEGDNLIEINKDDDEKGFGISIGSIDAVSLEKYTIDIKKTGKAKDIHPIAVHINETVGQDTLWTSIMNLAEKIDEEGLAHDQSYRASKDLLMKRSPRLIDGKAGANLLPNEPVHKAAIRLALTLDRSILPIQGPPGTGKTHVGSMMIIELIKAKKKVGITAMSHRVIFTLVEKIRELSLAAGIEIKFAHKINDKIDFMPDWVAQIRDTAKIIEAIGQGSVIGGTAWLWASEDLSQSLDYLFIDEAGQMSLSQALASSRAAKNIVLLGDPQQLEQPQKGSHPEGSDVASLTYLLDGKQTMPEEKGLFLNVTRRMHPKITSFTSELFYENKLESLAELKNQLVTGGTSFDGAGLFFVPVDHSGNRDNSSAEVGVIRKIVDELLQKGKWTDKDGQSRQLTTVDILVVAPYNAQVAALLEKIPELAIGTVDKFQGKEAPIVIYSMTSSSVQEAPRGMNFLFNPNRLNVATSRAKSVCILVASPSLLEPECHTIDQMRWANGLCRFVELTKTNR